MNSIKEYQNGDQILKIYQDENPESPREWDNIGEMLTCHGHYKLGDKQFSSPEEIENYMKEKGVFVKLPLYLLDHSGITMSTKSFNDPWDSGQVGYVFVSKEKAKTKKVTKKNAIQCMISEVNTYDQYLRGDVYGFQVVKKTKCSLDEEHEEVLDSCWGFYGHDPKENGISSHVEDFDKFKEV